MNRTVEIISKKMKYRKFTYPAIARYDDSLGNYITGQHAAPGDTSGLTKEEIEDPSKMSATRKKKYPYIIMADTPYHIKHMTRLQIGLNEDETPINPKDYALYQFYLTLPEVAKSEKDFHADSKHIFYIRDREQEAENEITAADQWFEAMSKVKENTAIENLENIAIMLNYSIPNFNINIGASSKTRLEKQIYEACKNHPAKVLDCFKDGSEEVLFVLRLTRAGIISRRNESFYDGEKFVGNSVQDVIEFMHKKEGAAFKDKWGNLLSKLGK